MDKEPSLFGSVTATNSTIGYYASVKNVDVVPMVMLAVIGLETFFFTRGERTNDLYNL